MRNPLTPCFSLVALACAVGFLHADAAHAATRFVVAVGARTGLADEDPLQYADADARRFREVFVELGAVAPERAALVLDGDVQALEIELARLQGQVEEAVRQGERVEVIFYASGHGDAESLHLAGARYPLAVLKDKLMQLPADATVLVLDACRTPVVDRRQSKGAVPGPAFDVAVSREVAPRGFVTLYAAREGEAAQESDALEGAYFTHHLVVGLRGAADFDGDKKVTLAEAWRHAHQTTLARSHATAAAQHPEMQQALEGEAELVLVDLSRARAVLSLPAAIAGDLLLFDAVSGRVLLEVKKPAGRVVDVALPARRVRVQLRPAATPQLVRVGEVDLGFGGAQRLDSDALQEQPLLAAVQKGGSADPTPWIASVVGGVGGSSLALPEWGADASVARRITTTPVFVRVRAGGARAALDDEVAGVAWRYTHLSGRAAAGAEAELWLSTVRLAAGLEAGVQFLKQDGARHDAARLAAQGFAVPVVDTWGAGPLGCIDGSVLLPLAWNTSLVVMARAGASVLPVATEPTLVPWADARIGVAFEW